MEEALAAAQEAGVPLQLGFQRRYDSSHIHAHRMVAEGKLGQIVFAHSHTRDATPRTDYTSRSGGIFRDTCVHDFDALRFILGDEVVEITAVSNVSAEGGFVTAGGPEIASITLRFAGGTLAQVNTVRGILYGFDVRTEVIGTDASVAGGFAREVPVTEFRREGESSAQAYWFPQRFAQAYVDELRAWVENVLSDRPVSPTGDDGRQALRLAIAAEESLRRGGQTVDLAAFEQDAAPEPVAGPAPRRPATDEPDDEMEATPGDIY
jgi:myo-inositol 2-dehydrogenase/D-chiro-inositol 1-dehydrogenase